MNIDVGKANEPTTPKTGIVKELFLGKITDDALFPFPQIRARDGEVRCLVQLSRQWMIS